MPVALVVTVTSLPVNVFFVSSLKTLKHVICIAPIADGTNAKSGIRAGAGTRT